MDKFLFGILQINIIIKFKKTWTKVSKYNLQHYEIIEQYTKFKYTLFRFLPKLATGLLIAGGALDGASFLIPTNAEASTVTDVLSDPEQCLEFLLWQPQNIDYAFKMSENNPKIRQNLLLLSTVLQSLPRN